MRRLSIKIRITLWFAILILLLSAIAFSLILMINNTVLQSDVRDTLLHIVTYNSYEIEYQDHINDEELSDGDQYLRLNNGFLEIDDDFLTFFSEVHTALYDQEGQLLYGETIETEEPLPFADGVTRTYEVRGERYYLYDCRVQDPNLSSLWLRGAISARKGTTLLSRMVKLSLYLLPLLSLLTILGGYLLARRALRPVEEIRHSADSIREGKDLKQRIPSSDANDELHHLSLSFNSMFDRLEDAFASERRFTQDASHELRTPLAVIRTECEYALDRPRTSEEYVESLQVIDRQSRRMNALVSDLLFSARARRMHPADFSSVPFSAIVSDACTTGIRLQEKNITLTCSVEPNITVRGNADMLQRIVLNLISNAYRYGKPDGTILVSLYKTDGAVILSVKDDGIGISAEHLPHLFERFYRADVSRSSEGSGLGLHLVREIAELHQGEVSVTSVVGIGSEFIVRLPLG